MLLPKKNLSYSQIALWNKTKTHREYIMRYFFKEQAYEIRELLFGREVAKELEKDNLFDVREDWRELFSTLPTIGMPEVPVVCQMKGFYTLSYLDRCSNDYSKVIEFKTGKKEWTLERALESEQLKFYSWCIEKNFGIIPEIELIWLETEDNPASEFGLQFTGKRVSHEVVFTDTSYIEEMIYQAAHEIQEAYRHFINRENLAEIYNWR